MSDCPKVSNEIIFPKCDENGKIKYRGSSSVVGVGTQRIAYAGIVNRDHRGIEKGTKVVMKKFIDIPIWESGEWNDEIECYEMAKYLSDKWNKRKYMTKKLELYIPRKAVKKRGLGNKVKVGEWVLVERYLEGEWQKWNSNNGYVHHNTSPIHAFCHWTYHHSKGRLLFCDVQGVKTKNSYILSDPCIVTNWDPKIKDSKPKYGLSDGGIQCITSFFLNHKCNKYCKKHWLKPKYLDITIQLNKGKGTTYVWDVKNKSRKSIVKKNDINNDSNNNILNNSIRQ